MKGAIDSAQEILASRKNAFMPNQFANPANPRIHRETKEICTTRKVRSTFWLPGFGTGDHHRRLR
jgi:cysteine synthase A